MTVRYNRELAEERGLSQEEMVALDVLYSKLEMFLTRPTMYANEEGVLEVIHGIETCLQLVWGFPPDRSKHRYAREFECKQQWAGRSFKCVKSGEVFTIPWDVYETACYQWGEGALLDVGRLGFYSRMSGCVEITEE